MFFGDPGIRLPLLAWNTFKQRIDHSSEAEPCLHIEPRDYLRQNPMEMISRQVSQVISDDWNPVFELEQSAMNKLLQSATYFLTHERRFRVPPAQLSPMTVDLHSCLNYKVLIIRLALGIHSGDGNILMSSMAIW